MPLNLDGYEQKVSKAVQAFWDVREKHGVRGGKTLDAFIKLLEWVVHNNGLPNARVLHGSEAKLPGYFRPAKTWDIIIINNEILIGAIELKSIADSFGKNANNRNEEALGSGIDLKEAFAENAFEGLTSAFVGYILLVEDCPATECTVAINMKHFRILPEFMAHPEQREKTYIRNPKGHFPRVEGLSYMDRFDILCKHLMKKKLYDSACVIKAKRKTDGSYSDVSPDTSIKAFLARLAAHAEITSIKSE